jgi:hypothetical protein
VKAFPFAILVLVGVAACQELATEPQSGTGLMPRGSLSNPPPPPIDTGASGSFSPNQTFSVAQSGGFTPRYVVTQTEDFFTIPVRYFLNTEDTNGYLHFSNDTSADVLSTANGSVKYQNGLLSGKGSVTLQMADGSTLVIDLSSIEQPPASFFGCSTPLTTAAAAPQDTGGVCFHLFFDRATLTPPGGGTPVSGSVDLRPEQIVVGCEISCPG